MGALTEIFIEKEGDKVLAIQSEIKRLGSIEAAAEEYKLKIKHHESEPLVILNYCQVESPKLAEAVRDCRGLVLHSVTHEVVARPFRRFFNWGEAVHLQGEFDWDSAEVETKEDGSLIILYYWNGKWEANTRGSFGDGNVGFSSQTFRSLFLDTVAGAKWDKLPRQYTYLLELVGPLNKVVRSYDRQESRMLAAIHTETGEEMGRDGVLLSAEILGIDAVERHPLKTLSQIREFIKRQEDEDPTFEGFVVVDKNGTRWKIKSGTYVALHQLRGDDNIYNPRHMLPFILKGESDEVLTYFPEAREFHDRLAGWVASEHDRMLAAWDRIGDIEDQKEFALALQSEEDSWWRGILFRSRKSGENPSLVWRESESIILKSWKNHGAL